MNPKRLKNIVKRIVRNIAFVVVGIVVLAFLLNFFNRSEYGSDLEDRISIFSNNEK